MCFRNGSSKVLGTTKEPGQPKVERPRQEDIDEAKMQRQKNQRPGRGPSATRRNKKLPTPYQAELARK